MVEKESKKEEKYLKHIEEQIVNAVMQGKFEKRIMIILKDSPKLADVLNLFMEMRKDFPTPEEISTQLSFLSMFIENKSVLEALQNHLKKEYEAVWKWLGEDQQ